MTTIETKLMSQSDLFEIHDTLKITFGQKRYLICKKMVGEKVSFVLKYFWISKAIAV